MLAWLSVWSEMQTCIWPSWCHCHSLSLVSVKSRLVLPFWYRLTRVVPEKGPLNVCDRLIWLTTGFRMICWRLIHWSGWHSGRTSVQRLWDRPTPSCANFSVSAICNVFSLWISTNVSLKSCWNCLFCPLLTSGLGLAGFVLSPLKDFSAYYVILNISLWHV